MKKAFSIFSLILPLFLSACSSEDFEGRYTDQEGLKSYEFLPEGELRIVSEESETLSSYEYDASDKVLTLISEPNSTTEAQVNEDGSIQLDATMLTRAVDESMLANSTWIGNQGEYTFTLTFTPTQKGLETYSELVTYYTDDMTYAYQTDDSITRLSGNKLFLDQTIYTVSDVTDTRLKLSIGQQSMVLHKHPKGTAIEFREAYSNIDDE